jgi:hypothetical protein
VGPLRNAFEHALEHRGLFLLHCRYLPVKPANHGLDGSTNRCCSELTQQGRREPQPTWDPAPEPFSSMSATRRHSETIAVTRTLLTLA